MHLENTQRTYDRIAARYAARNVYPMTEELAAFLRHLPVGSTIIDAGCGTGDYAQMIVARGYRVVAVDLSLGMLAQARRKGVPLAQADMRRLPLPSECAEGCFLSASLLHLPRAETSLALREIHRVLRDPGVAFLSLKAGEGSAAQPEPEGGMRYFVYYQPAALDQRLQAAGFAVIDGWISPPGKGQRKPWIARVVRKEPQ